MSKMFGTTGKTVKVTMKSSSVGICSMLYLLSIDLNDGISSTLIYICSDLFFEYIKNNLHIVIELLILLNFMYYHKFEEDFYVIERFIRRVYF